MTRDEKIREEISNWLKVNNISRQELSLEAGYNRTYLNNLMSIKTISPRAETNLREAMKRISLRQIENLDEITVPLTETEFDDILKAAKKLRISLNQFIDKIISNLGKRPLPLDSETDEEFDELLESPWDKKRKKEGEQKAWVQGKLENNSK